jgi:hypothetical protein
MRAPPDDGIGYAPGGSHAALTGKEFLRSVANGKVDLLEVLLDVLRRAGADYCVIGGLAVNAYAEPVVSLDLDIVVVAQRLDAVRSAALARGMKVEESEHSVNLALTGSDLRVQLQKDPRYQGFIGRAGACTVLGYELPVARLEDVVAGKLWAYADSSRRASKRQKDLADLMRLVETHPHISALLPESVLALMR